MMRIGVLMNRLTECLFIVFYRSRMSNNKFFNLDSSLIREIFEFDPTFYDIFSNKVLRELVLYESKKMYKLFLENWQDSIKSSRWNHNRFTITITDNYSYWGDNIYVVQWEKLENKKIKFIIWNHNQHLYEYMIV